jgi:hypothetical protein
MSKFELLAIVVLWIGALSTVSASAARSTALPMAGLVKMPDGRLDCSDCFYYGAHLETAD